MLPVTQSTLVMIMILASVNNFIAPTNQLTSTNQHLKSQRSKFFQLYSTKSDKNVHDKKYYSPPPKSKPIDFKEKYLMPFITTGSALTQQLKLKPLNLNSKKFAKKIFSANYQPIIPLRFDFSNHRPKDSNLLEKVYSLGSSLPLRLFYNEDDATHRNEDKSKVPKIVAKLSEKSSREDEDSSEHKRTESSTVNNQDRDKEDSIVNQPIASHRRNRVSRIDFNKKEKGDQEKNNSSYASKRTNQRFNGKATKTRNNSPMSLSNPRLLFEPSLESIAMRIVSAAASKTMGRSNHAAQSSSSSSNLISHSSSSNDITQPSFLSSFSSTILSTAISHIMNMTSTDSGSIDIPSSWPAKIGPLLQTLASISGLDSVGSLPLSPPSFLQATDLSSASSSSIPTIIGSNGTRPHSAKQYSSTVTGLINLMRYVLCEYWNPHIFTNKFPFQLKTN